MIKCKNVSFAGRQDAMQRQSLVALKSFMDKKGSVDGSGLAFLEVAGGTGRYATFVKVGSKRGDSSACRRLGT